MAADDLARQGIAALKAGDTARARELLTQATQSDPQNQVAFLWLTAVVDNQEEKRQYLQRVVDIDPSSDPGKRAAAGLAQLGASAPTVPVPPAMANEPVAPPPASPDVEPIPNPQGQPSWFADLASGGSSSGGGEEGGKSGGEQPSLFGVPSSGSEPAPEPASSSPFNIPSSSSSASPFNDPDSGSSTSVFGVPSSEASEPSGSGGQSSSFSVPDDFDVPAAPKSSGNRNLIIAIVAAVVLVPCVCIGGSFALLAVLGAAGESVGGGTFSGGDAPDYPVTGGGTLRVGGGSVSGNLDSLFEADDWRFQGEAGQSVTIRCQARGGQDTDPRIHLIAPGGGVVADDDDGGQGYNSLISNVTLPETGTYTIRVDVFTRGDYVLWIE